MTDISPHLDPTRRHEAVILLDVKNGNPNGDPDAANQPRVDPETNRGLITDVSIKRRIRDYVSATREDADRYKIYVEHRASLTEQRTRIFDAHDLDTAKGAKGDTKAQGRRRMIEHFYDVRMFGAVMSMDTANSGQVRGPVQLTFAESLDPISIASHSIARVAREEAVEAGKDQHDHGTFGDKHTVPYGLYRAHLFFAPHLADKAGVTSEDLSTLWDAITNMYDLDRSAARGEMAVRGLYVFSHQGRFGNMPAHQTLAMVDARKHEGVIPRSHTDYDVTRELALPETVSFTSVVHGW